MMSGTDQQFIFSSEAWRTDDGYFNQVWNPYRKTTKGTLGIDGESLTFVSSSSDRYFSLLFADIKIAEFKTGNILRIHTKAGKKYRIALYDFDRATLLGRGSKLSEIQQAIAVMETAGAVAKQWQAALSPYVPVSTSGNRDIAKMTRNIMIISAVCVFVFTGYLFFSYTHGM